MNRFIYLSVVLVSILLNPRTGKGQIQANTNSYLKSPSVSTLEKFGSVPVSLYSGIPEISIPVYTIQSKDIVIPITLNYHAGGVRVEEESSMIGLGWNLAFSGVIYRKVNGQDDLRYGSTITPPYLDESIVDFVTHDAPTRFYFNSTTTITSALRGVIDFTSYLNDAPVKDFQPDEFNVSLPGYSGKFVVDRQGNAFLEKKDNTKIKLIRHDTDYLQTEWVITTGDGFKYYFETADIIRTLDSATPDYISAWYLTRIVSAGGDVVTFNYTQDNYNLIENTSNFYEQSEDMQFNTTTSGPYDAINSSCPVLFDQLQQLPKTDLKQQRLTSIDFQNGRLHFDYATRIDKQGEKRLQRIRLVQKDETPINAFTFIQDYFEQNTGGQIPPFLVNNDLSTKRLKLLRFEKGEGAEKAVYSFEYNESKLPPKYSFARDHWGYYNGENFNNSLIAGYIGPMKAYSNDPDPVYVAYSGANRDPDPEFSQCFILKKINYPTGGHTQFEYETNDYDIQKSGNYLKYDQATGKLSYFRSAEGDQVKRISFTIPDSEEDFTQVTIFLNVLKDIGDPADSKYHNGYFKISNAETNFVWANESISDISLFNSQGTSMFVTLERVYALPPGDYHIDLFLQRSIDWIRNVDLTYKWIIKPETYAKSKKREWGGGLRVRKIIDYDEISRKSVERNFQYGQVKNGEYRSFGRVMSVPVYDDISNTWSTIRANAAGIETDAVVECRHFHRSASSIYDLFSGGGPVVGYDTVVVVYGKDGQQRGKTVNIFHNTSDVRIDYGDSHPGGMKNFRDPLNGQLLREAELKYNPDQQSFDTVSTKQYYYSKVAQTCYGMYSRKYAHLVDYSGLYGENHQRKWESFFYPVLYSTWIKLDAIKERSISGGQILVTITNNTYGSSLKNFLVKEQKTLSSGGDEITTEFAYSSDFLDFSGDPKALLASNLNLVNIPLETIKRIEKGADDYVVYGQLNEYTYVEEGELYKAFLSSTRHLNVESNLKRSDFNSLKDGNTIDNRYEINEEFIYDHETNTLKTHVEKSGIVTSFLWGYENEYPIAKCLNCRSDEFFYTGFEDDGVAESSGSTAHLGRRFHSGDYSLNFTMPNSKTYYYCYWYRENNVWTYSGIQGYTGSITLTNGDAIDDVKVYPSDARVTTYNFTPLAGISSITDENNQTSHFTYDNSGRLKIIKDQGKNIVGEYKYNYRVK